MTLRNPPQVVFAERLPQACNYVRFRLGPDVAIGIGARVKRSGEKMEGQPVELVLTRDPRHEAMGDYERLLGDAMEGDPQLFAREDLVEAAWAIVDPVLNADVPLHEYDPGSWGPAAADALVADVGGWHDTQGS